MADRTGALRSGRRPTRGTKQASPTAQQNNNVPPATRQDDSAMAVERERANCDEQIQILTQMLQMADEAFKASAQRVEALEASNKKLEEEIKREEKADETSKTWSQRVKALEASNKKLEEDNKQAVTDASNIYFRLSGYFNKILPKSYNIPFYKFGDAYDSVTRSVWGEVLHWFIPLYDDRARGEKVMSNARNNGEAAGMIEWMMSYPEIARLARYEHMEPELVTAIIMRWIHNMIISTNLYGVYPDTEQTLKAIESSIREFSNPKRTKEQIRIWRFVTYAGILANPEYPAAREARERALAKSLEGLVGFLRPNPNYDMFGRLLKEVIQPAVKLHEMSIGSIYGIRYEFPSVYAEAPDPDGILIAKTLVEENADRIICENVLTNTKKFKLDKRRDEIGKEKTIECLEPVCSMVPFVTLDLYEQDRIRNDYVVVRSRMLVAWGEKEERHRKLDNMKPSLLYGLIA
ncbi:hypothetical protein F5Y13DRAFT_183781 [Hypoxylon sp. FL1857]|nr:hypothetical protein F5Y13DRAFT_183781 [Hypoxylon sp. FL1857]